MTDLGTNNEAIGSTRAGTRKSHPVKVLVLLKKLFAKIFTNLTSFGAVRAIYQMQAKTSGHIGRAALLDVKAERIERRL